MMAHDLSQVAFVKTETQGEGNYASSVFSNTRDQETVQGLTLSPKIQSSDPWLFGAADAFGDQDLDALLGPVQFDLIAEEARRSNLDIDTLFNDEYQLPEPPAKKRKLTMELSKEPLPASEHIEPFCEHGPVSTPPGVHNVTKAFQCPASPSHPNQARKAMSPVVYNSPYADVISGSARTPSASLQPARPLDQATGFIRAVDKSNLPADLQDRQLPVVELCDEEPEAQVFDGFDDGDGSLFGGYDSSKEGSIVCSSIAEPSFGKKEVNSHAPESSIAPAVLWDPDVPIPSVERDLPPSGYYHTFQIPQVGETASKSSIGSGFKLDQKGTQAFPSRSLQKMLGETHNGTSGPERYQSQTNELSRFSSFQGSLPLSMVFALAGPVHRDSVEQTIKTTKASLASSTSKQSLPSNFKAHQVPPKLKNLLDSLQTKFNNDQSFRKSTIFWLIEKVDCFSKSKLSTNTFMTTN
jgi:hypothetical protein